MVRKTWAGSETLFTLTFRQNVLLSDGHGFFLTIFTFVLLKLSGKVWVGVLLFLTDSLCLLSCYCCFLIFVFLKVLLLIFCVVEGVAKVVRER